MILASRTTAINRSNDFCVRQPGLELSHPRLAVPCISINDEVAPQEYFFWEPFELPSFIKVIVRAVMRMGHAVLEFTCRVPHYDVSVRSRQQCAFLGVQTKDSSWVCAGQSNKLVHGYPAGTHTLCPHDRQTISHSW